MNRQASGVLIGLCLAVSGAACGGVEVEAERERHYSVAFLRAVATEGSPTERAILVELRRAGFIQGRNLTIVGREPGEAYPTPDEAEAALRSWDEESLAVVIAFSSSGAAAAAETAARASVLFISNEPVAAGLLRDEEAPEGRMTGVTFRVPADRTLDLARRAIPGLRRVGLAYPPSDPAAAPNRDAFAAAASDMDIELVTEQFEDETGAGDAVARLASAGAQILVISNSPTAIRSREAFEEASAAHGLPVVANTDVVGFAVLNLYPDGEALGRQLGRQVVRLLQGAPVSSVPVEDPRRFRIIVDQRMARDLGIEIPESIVLEADLVRE